MFPAKLGEGAAVIRDSAERMTKVSVSDQIKGRKAPNPALDEARLRQQAIGVKLRQMFDEVVNEPVPDEFLDILRRADKLTDR